MCADTMAARVTTAAPGPATLTHPVTGVREEASFLGPKGERLFGVLYRPAGPARAAVVVCPTLGPESLINYRQEVLLGRALAAKGFAVQRFLYRGTGSSDGRPEDLSFDGMVQDTLAAAAAARKRAGTGDLVFLGTRLGAMVAAAASRGGRAPLVLWDPVVSGDAFFRDMFLLRSTIDMAGRSDGSQPRASDELEARGWMDALGYKLSRELQRSLATRRLGTEAPDPGPVLLVQIGGRDGVQQRYAKLVESWGRAGRSDETVRTIADGDDWRVLFGRRVVSGVSPLATKLADITGEWLGERFPERGGERV